MIGNDANKRKRRNRRSAPGQLPLFDDAHEPAAVAAVETEPVPEPAAPDDDVLASMPKPPAKTPNAHGVLERDPYELAKWKRAVRRFAIARANLPASLKRLLYYLDSLTPAKSFPQSPSVHEIRRRRRNLFCWPSLKAITKALGLRDNSRRHVSRMLRELTVTGDPDHDTILTERKREHRDGSNASSWRWINYAECLRTVERTPARRQAVKTVPPAVHTDRSKHKPFDPSRSANSNSRSADENDGADEPPAGGESAGGGGGAYAPP